MTTDKNPHDLNPNGLDWLAFSYAAGELNPVEAEQFELRLADDQFAREALARAVELCQLVAAAEIQRDNDHYVAPAAKTRATWNHRLSWMAIGGLASLLLAVLWSGVIGPTWRTAQLHSFSQQNLAFAWTQAKHEIAAVREAGYWPALTGDTEYDNVSPAVFDYPADDAPSWMTAALLSAAPADSTDGEPSIPDAPNS